MTDQPTHDTVPAEDSLPAENPSAEDAGTRPDDDVKAAIEAIVMVADEPVDTQLLGQLVDVAPGRIVALCSELAADYEAQGRGFQLARVAGGYRFQSHPEQAPFVERYVLDGQSARLSAAALETLAIVAYKQPVSRAQVAAIRGVGVDGVMRTLQQRGYIDEIGRDPGPGQAVLFGTTRTFLERLGLDSLAQLPSLGDFVPGADVVEALEHGLRAAPAVALDDELAEAEAGDADHSSAGTPGDDSVGPADGADDPSSA